MNDNFIISINSNDDIRNNNGMYMEHTIYHMYGIRNIGLIYTPTSKYSYNISIQKQNREDFIEFNFLYPIDKLDFNLSVYVITFKYNLLY